MKQEPVKISLTENPFSRFDIIRMANDQESIVLRSTEGTIESASLLPQANTESLISSKDYG